MLEGASFDEHGFMLIWGARASYLVPRFPTKGIGPGIVVELNLYERERGNEASYSTILLTSISYCVFLRAKKSLLEDPKWISLKSH